MGSGVKEEVEKSVRQEALVLPKDGLQNLLQSVGRNGNLSCCHARGEMELGMPAGHFLKRKSNLHLKVIGLHAQLPRACAVVSAPSVMQELGVCRAMDRGVHRCSSCPCWSGYSLTKLENAVVSFAVIKIAVKLACLVKNQSGSSHINGP